MTVGLNETGSRTCLEWKIKIKDQGRLKDKQPKNLNHKQETKSKIILDKITVKTFSDMFRKIKVVLDICQYQCGLKYTIIIKLSSV